MNKYQRGAITVGQLLGCCVAVVVATVVVGFTWGGWVTGSGAVAMASQSSEQAVAERLGRICMAQARQSDDIQDQLEALRDVAAYRRTSVVMEKPWAVMPGESEADRAVAGACAEALMNT